MGESSSESALDPPIAGGEKLGSTAHEVGPRNKGAITYHQPADLLAAPGRCRSQRRRQARKGIRDHLAWNVEPGYLKAERANINAAEIAFRGRLGTETAGAGADRELSRREPLPKGIEAINGRCRCLRSHGRRRASR